MISSADQKLRAKQYADAQGLLIVKELGAGTDGAVWKTSKNTAIKVFERPRIYNTELASYQRLQEEGVRKLGRFNVPSLVEWDEVLLVIEITIVSPPYLIDFGKVYLDHPPDYSAEVWADYEEQQRELWGEKLGEVQALLWRLETMGIYYVDPTPKNIAFGD
jgi:hypothetical protein